MPTTEFTIIRANRRTAIVRYRDAETIAAALVEGRGCVSAGTGGRGALLSFPYADGTGIIRRYRRGGLVRHLVRETYLFRNRAKAELAILRDLCEAGLPVPEPLGCAWEQWACCFRGNLATRQVDAVPLPAYVTSHPTEAPELMRRCGALIRRMHDLGVMHADLQVLNLLAGPDGLYLIDFDKARRFPALSRRLRNRALLRLRRSFVKRGLPLVYFVILLEGYGADQLGWRLRRSCDGAGKHRSAEGNRERGEG